MRGYSNWQWHLDEVFAKIDGETHYLWRAVDHEGKVLESHVTKRLDRRAALNFLKKSMKRYGDPHVIVTDLLRSYGAAMKVVGNAQRQETGRWLNNRCENSHLPFSTNRASHAALAPNGKFAEIHRRSCIDPQPFQPGAPPVLTRHFQAQPDRRPVRVAPTWRGIRGSFIVLAEASSHSSDSTDNPLAKSGRFIP